MVWLIINKQSIKSTTWHQRLSVSSANFLQSRQSVCSISANSLQNPKLTQTKTVILSSAIFTRGVSCPFITTDLDGIALHKDFRSPQCHLLKSLLFPFTTPVDHYTHTHSISQQIFTQGIRMVRHRPTFTIPCVDLRNLD